jgi:hypothetical protein
VIREDAKRFPVANGAPWPEPVETFLAAIADVAQLTLGLTSAIAEHTYTDGAHLRGELEAALCRAQVLAEHIPNGSQRAEALRQLGEMHAVATRTLMIAPAPSAAAIEAAEAGDPTAWNREKQAWIEGRLATGSSPRLPAQRRERRETRPERPQALRETSGEDHDADAVPTGSALAASSASAPGKAGPQ